MNAIDRYLQSPPIEGQRNLELYKHAAFALNDGWPESKAQQVLGDKARRDGLTDHEITRTIASAYRTTPRASSNPAPRKRKGGALDWENITLLPPSQQRLSDDPTPETITPEESAKQIADYLRAVFEPGELVGYIQRTFEKGGRMAPADAGEWRERDELITLCEAGDTVPIIGQAGNAGAFIRFNPLDGAGAKDANVTAYRHALVESDSVPIDKQREILQKLELPITALVHSGNKSLHAIVRVDAEDRAQYVERVAKLYDICEAEGLPLDKQNKNPSRLSRLPGVMRSDKVQALEAVNIGRANWSEWRAWMIDRDDDLPPMATLDIGNGEPPVRPEIIEGMLREGHKLLIAGPSKAGKSFLLQQLALSASCGGEWLGHRIGKPRKVLYVNLELDPQSSRRRFWTIAQKLQILPKRSITIWDLRGRAVSLRELAPRLVRRVHDSGVELIIIDPIYKVLTGDENSASEMAEFCNLFDMISTELNAAIVYCHHHSKGAQGQKASHDRASGSGVFARDPDAIIDLIELMIGNERRDEISEAWELAAMRETLAETGAPVPELGTDELMRWTHSNAAGVAHDVADARAKAQDAAAITTGWRVEATLREFAPPAPRRMFFRYPVHVDSSQMLQGAFAAGENENPATPTQSQQTTPATPERKQQKREQTAAIKRLISIEKLRLVMLATAEENGKKHGDEARPPSGAQLRRKWAETWGKGISHTKLTGLIRAATEQAE